MSELSTKRRLSMEQGSRMSERAIIGTYDWVPGGEGSPRGFVRDIRLRWACEEAGLDYVVYAMRVALSDFRQPDEPRW